MYSCVCGKKLIDWHRLQLVNMQGICFTSRLVCYSPLKFNGCSCDGQAMLFLVTCREEHGPHVWVGDLELTPPSAAFGEYIVHKTCPTRITVLCYLLKASWHVVSVNTYTNLFCSVCSSPCCSANLNALAVLLECLLLFCLCFSPPFCCHAGICTAVALFVSSVMFWKHQKVISLYKQHIQALKSQLFAAMDQQVGFASLSVCQPTHLMQANKLSTLKLAR